ncbi:AAA family ATPase [Cellulomonas humilata]|uniref:ABC-type transport system involved in cytochrome c biogenesis ATPase subunit n=1 Tax=Cellulomonas humilata TaxID=144055 RepID=A0ABU0EL07_9CELL|nr:AAA family ATPase [Cellulomonas humilata]MDQ0375972.1 ABC-type transport system involved in cytochrome c biogenesis ATPase subunit [Cellulomonas humilata]
MLAHWANDNDEWVRLLVSEVIVTGRPVGATTIEKAYQVFRQEKALDKRELPTVAKLIFEAQLDESAPPLAVTRLSEVHGVNALIAGAVIEPHEGLTILYGENGTGKTGYSRIFKALANSRTADTILGNVETDPAEGQTAKVEFKLGDDEQSLTWTGERGVSPFTRMSIFDSPAVTTHVDDDLDYVYTPASLALFNHVTAAIQAVTAQIDAAIGTLSAGSSGLISRFQRGSRIYPLIEALGASTDLADLKAKAVTDGDADQKLDVLTQAVGALRANTMGTQIAALRAEQRVLTQAVAAAEALLAFDATAYNETLVRRAELTVDHETFRSELFAAADLPADPDDSWSNFIEAGEKHRQHLVELEAHDSNRCLYCRQPLLDPARVLIARYSIYLEDKISADIRATDTIMAGFKRQITNIKNSELVAFIGEYSAEEEKPTHFSQVVAIEGASSALATAVAEAKPASLTISAVVTNPNADVEAALATVGANISTLETLQQNRAQVLEEKQAELLESKAAVELGKSWPLIEAQVKSAKEADQLKTLKRPLPSQGRAVTELAKTASDQLINQSFDVLFLEECEALRARPLKLQFVGREGRAQRRKVMSGRHKPSKVLSEGEQKVLALADFLAEARLAGITAPVIFDDPVSSLDHRRINEVAQRIARLADDNQVIVFTHDILFATTLLGLFEKSKRCVYFQVTDEDGKGKVTRATGPRWDTLSGIRGKINTTIEAAKQQDGEARDALVRVGYGWLRSWCEVFTETELFQGVTQRYQPNVGMTRLQNVNTDKLGDIIPKVTEVFEEACRYIDGHSQPLVTLGVSPTLAGLEQRWAELRELKKLNEDKS